MKTKTFRFAPLFAGLAIVAAACTPGASTAPSPSAAAASQPATSEAPTASASGSAEASGSAGASGEPSASAAAVQLEGALTIWHSYSSGAGTELDALNQVLDEVKAESPGLQIDVLEVPFNDLYNKYNADAATGAGPDLFIAPNDSLGFQAREEVILDLDQYLADKLGDISETAVEGSKVDGKLYMVPESLKAVAMFYNADTVDQAPATTDELLEAVEGGLKAGFFGGNNGLYHNFGWWAAFGGELMDESGKCTADAEGVAEAYQYLADLQEAGAQFFPNYDDMANGFKAGDLDLIIDGPWATGGYREAVSNLAVAPMPEGPAGPAQPLSGVDGWYVNPSTADPQLAVDFALRMTNESAQTIFAEVAGHIPANTNVEISDPITQGFAEAVSTGFPRPQVAALDNFWGNFGNAQQQILETGVDPAVAIPAACAAMNEANGL
jgi:arabinogalactan oligomer/maltooligosaccharide transport system substrate-binding protein